MNSWAISRAPVWIHAADTHWTWTTDLAFFSALEVFREPGRRWRSWCWRDFRVKRIHAFYLNSHFSIVFIIFIKSSFGYMYIKLYKTTLGIFTHICNCGNNKYTFLHYLKSPPACLLKESKLHFGKHNWTGYGRGIIEIERKHICTEGLRVLVLFTYANDWCNTKVKWLG